MTTLSGLLLGVGFGLSSTLLGKDHINSKDQTCSNTLSHNDTYKKGPTVFC